jgi:hypothetical protein
MTDDDAAQLVDDLREQYAQNEADHERHPTEQGFTQWLAHLYAKAVRGDDEPETMGQLHDRLPSGVWVGLPEHGVQVKRAPDAEPQA